jgi:hypothetical protein
MTRKKRKKREIKVISQHMPATLAEDLEVLALRLGISRTVLINKLLVSAFDAWQQSLSVGGYKSFLFSGVSGADEFIEGALSRALERQGLGLFNQSSSPRGAVGKGG